MAKLFSIPTYKDPRGFLSVIEKILPLKLKGYIIFMMLIIQKGAITHIKKQFKL